MEISQKVAYLKGLAEGLALDTEQGLGFGPRNPTFNILVHATMIVDQC